MRTTEQGAANYGCKVMNHSHQEILQRIYVFRNQHVMLDSDLAQLYQIHTWRLNETVTRNCARFPDSFMFQLTQPEYESLKEQVLSKNYQYKMNKYSLTSQFAMSNSDMKLLNFSEFNTQNKALISQFNNKTVPTQNMDDTEEAPILDSTTGRGGRRTLPRVFTEQGVAMLSAVLKTDLAVQVSITIMESFVQLRKEKATAPNATAIQISQVIELMLEAFRELREEIKEQNRTVLAAIGKIQQTKSHHKIPVFRVDALPGSIEKQRSKIAPILTAVAKYYCLRVEDLQINTRKKSIAFPRQVAIYLVRKETDLSLKEIAFLFGRDHTTVLHACEKIAAKVNTCSEFSAGINNILNLKTQD